MNTNKRTLNLALVALLVTGAFVSFAPEAEAQLAEQCGNAIKATIEPDINPPTEPIKPITESPIITGKFTYKAEESARSLTPITVTFDAKPDDASWATVSIAPKTFDLNVATQGATSVPIPIQITVNLNRDAPAFKTQNIRVSAVATDGTCVKAPTPQEVILPIQAGFYQRYQAQFDKAIWQTGQNSQVQIPLTIMNFGNGDIEIRLAINDQTSKALNVAPPAQVTVKSMVGGGDTDRETVNIDVQTPFKNGYTNQRDKLVLDLKGNSADDPEILLTELQLNAVVQTQGVYVPGFETVTMLTALLGALFVARRRLL